nr:hypothetical protein [Tanacetum cinerariifolium]
ATVMEEKDDGFKEFKSRKKKKGADSRSFGGLRLNKPNSKVIWQQKKSGDTKGGTQPSVSIYNNDNGVSNPGFTTANPFDVLNGNGADMGESETQQKDVINESDTTDDEAGFTPFSTSMGCGNQLEDEDSDFYDGYEDQVVDLHGALKEYRDFMLSMSDWLEDTNEKVDDQELETHYMYMAKIQEVHITDLGPSFDTKPLENVHSDNDYNVFANERQHYEQPISINNTYVVKKIDSNVIPDSSDMCDNDNQADQNVDECDDERVVLANIIAIKKANTSLSHELQECKSALEECKFSLENSNRN